MAVVGGGPAGAFFAIHLLRKARKLGRAVRVTLFERRCGPPHAAGAGCRECWAGCNSCAGGISPKLNDILARLKMPLPEPVIQSRIHSITIQGLWKNIELGIPEGRQMLSVFRSSRPLQRTDRENAFDNFLLGKALEEGAELIPAEAFGAKNLSAGRSLVWYRNGDGESSLEADFVVLAGGVKEYPHAGPAGGGLASPLLSQLLPDYVPPRRRKVLLFELESPAGMPAHLAGTMHLVEYGSRELPVEMCSILVKRRHVSVTVIGQCADTLALPSQNTATIRRFMELPHIRKLFAPADQFRLVCACNPWLVVGTAKGVYRDGVAVVGDLATSRLYKDGIRSAHDMAQALAHSLLHYGTNRASLRHGYAPVVERFERDNQYAERVFLAHRIIFTSNLWSRILYQAVITERKEVPARERRLARLLWKIASGDDDYEATFRAMLSPPTVWTVLKRGVLITARNWLTESFFGLHWAGFGRFTTGIAKERFEAKRLAFVRSLAEVGIKMPKRLGFERMYTIKIHTAPANVTRQLARFGEADRGYLHPRWVTIRRVAGEPHTAGCVVRYEIFSPRFSFNLKLVRFVENHLAVYGVQDGFARGGVLIFEIESRHPDNCELSIYVGFNFARGGSLPKRLFYGLFRRLFPAFVHDVIWNHSLCELKDIAEHQARGPEIVPVPHPRAEPAPELQANLQ